MKRLIILIIALCVMNISHAQEKKCSMLDGDPVWIGYYIRYSGRIFYYKFYLDGTTVIDDKVYHKLYCDVVETGPGSDHWGIASEDGYVFGLREENGRIYVNSKEYLNSVTYEQTEDGEVVLYDFNVEDGYVFNIKDVRTQEVVERCKVAETGSVTLLNGEVRKVFTMDSEPCYHIIENIGAVDFRWSPLFFHMISPSAVNMSDLGHCLNVFMQNGEVVYKAPDYEGDPSKESLSWTTYRADPFLGDLSTGIKDVNADKAAERDNSIYDLTGRKLSAKPEKGIYIQGGKKYVVR